jgi:cation:H+ antiporter
MNSDSRRAIYFLIIAAAVAAIGPFTRFIAPEVGLHLGTITESILYGLAILGAAFLLSWTTEAAEVDISKGLAVAVLAFIAVLPEYAVDASITWRAAKDPEIISLAVANMTGANRILIGLALPMIFFIFWRSLRNKKSSTESKASDASTPITILKMPRSTSVELILLLAAVLYSFILPLKGGITIIDTAILFSIFGGYLYLIGRQASESPDLMGPALLIGTLPTNKRRLSLVLLFLFSAGIVFTAADPFAQGLEHTGEELGIDKFLLLQFVAPLASESPEFLVCGILAFRGHASLAMAALISSKLNQWTLLLGSLPLVFSASSGEIATLPLQDRQQLEIFLTAAQGLFAVALFMNLKVDMKATLSLVILFLIQAVLPYDEIRLAIGILYILLTFVLIYSRRNAIKLRFKDFWQEFRTPNSITESD